MGLTAKQEAFCYEYLIDLNATQAAIRAGYSKKTAGSVGNENLQKPEIAEVIQEALDARSKRTEITADYVLQGIQEIAERCLQRAPVMEGRGEDRKQATDLETGAHLWTFDSSGANKAFENLGKHLKLFTEKHEHTGKDGGAIQTQATIDVSRLSDSALTEILAARLEADAG